jgi:hypothetical protein
LITNKIQKGGEKGMNQETRKIGNANIFPAKKTVIMGHKREEKTACKRNKKREGYQDISCQKGVIVGYKKKEKTWEGQITFFDCNISKY